MKKKILVTGGTGFLGAYIIQELVHKGYQVRAIQRTKKFPDFIDHSSLQQVEWVEGDILDIISLQEAMIGIDAVIHSAAVVSFIPKEKSIMYQVNVEGTANAVNMALEAGVSRFIHISSVAALGRLSTGGQVDEEKKWEESKVNTDYAKSKHKAELEVYRGIGEGMDAVILNPSTLIGYGDWNSSSCAIFKNIYNGFKFYTSGLNGFVAVEDVARAAVAFLENEISAERFLLNGDNWPFQKLQYAIADGFHKKRPSKKAGPFLLGIAWRMQAISSFFSGHPPLLTRQSAKVALSETRFYSQKIGKFLPGFSFTPIETSIKHACEKYLQGLK